MSPKIFFFTFIITIICPFIIKAQNQPVNSLIIKDNPNAKELYLKLKFPKHWRAEHVKPENYSTLGVLYNNSKTNKIYITFKETRFYTLIENKALIDKQNIEATYLKYSNLGLALPNLNIINQTKLSVDTYPALMMSAKVQTKSILGKQKKFYRTSFLIFHEGLALEVFTDYQNLKELKTNEQLLQSIIKSINFPEKKSDEQLKIKTISNSLCNNLHHSLLKAKDVPNWQKTFEEHLNFKGTDKEFTELFHNFLNSNKNSVICRKYKVGALVYPQQHLYKRILAIGMDETYEEYFFNLEEGEIDFNAYEIVDGKKETVLDWIEKWIATGKGTPELLRDIAYSLKDEFGAKEGKDLLD